MTREHAELVHWCTTYPEKAANEIAALRSAIDCARSAFLVIEKRSEECRALVTATSGYLGAR